MEQPATILVVDDDERSRVALTDVLEQLGYSVCAEMDGVAGLAAVTRIRPDVILLDVGMPGLDGFEVARRLKEREDDRVIPIVMVTGRNDVESRVRALKIGVDDFLAKPPHVAELTARVRSLVKVKAYNDHLKNYQRELEQEVQRRTAELAEANARLREAALDTIYRLSRAAEFRDEDTGAHIRRISRYAGAIARRLGLPASHVETIIAATLMHDVGKIGIPDRILLKPGKLDPDEWAIMKQHTTLGARILEDSASPFICCGRLVAISHHERWDGTGYPAGIRGDAIPVEGRIAAIADVFDALVSRRPYKEPLPLDRSLEIIRAGAGTHFDPGVVEAFFAVREEIEGIRHELPDEQPSALRTLDRGGTA